MFPSIFVIRRTEHYSKVRKNGKVFQSDNFFVSILKTTPETPHRFGFIVGGSCSKFAVHRNRIKRALKEVIRRNMNNVPNGLDIVFVAKESMDKMMTENIMKETQNWITSFDFSNIDQ